MKKPFRGLSLELFLAAETPKKSIIRLEGRSLALLSFLTWSVLWIKIKEIE